MNSLGESGAVESLVTRLGKLHSERPRAWGRMTPHEMMCHLADSFEVGLGVRPFAPVDAWMQRTVVRYVALRTPLAWPKSLETRPEVKQGAGGTRPVDFEQDRARLTD